MNDASPCRHDADLSPARSRRKFLKTAVRVAGAAGLPTVVSGKALGLDLLNNPKLLTLPENGTRSAVWFWNRNNLSQLADKDWFRTITRRINGGYNGLSDRRNYWDRNRSILGLPMVDLDRESDDIKAFQRTHGLAADGVVGSITQAML